MTKHGSPWLPFSRGGPTITRLLMATHFFASLAFGAWTYPEAGWATMTHYDLPRDYLASCGCTRSSTHYPTAALSTLAYGSTAAYGPSCGRCFNLTLLNTFFSNPPFYPPESKSLVVKIIDRCPSDGLCGATDGQPNSAGAYLNFDLAYPSKAIPNDFFPSNESLYGYTDFGVWNISYQSTTCADWSGWDDEGALGSVPDMAPGVCCPAEPSSNLTCPSYSEQYGTPPPDTTTNQAYGRSVACWLSVLLFQTAALLAVLN